MMTPLPLFLIQHAYFFGTVPENLPVVPNSIISNFSQSLNVSQQIPTPNLQPRRSDYKYSSAEIGAHKIEAHLHTWNEARAYCEEDGGHLAIINSAAEAGAIAKLLNELKIKRCWIGVHDFFQEGQFVTILDTPLTKTGFNVWHAGEPNNLRTKENCVTLSSQRKMSDEPCEDRRNFVCEMPYVP